MIGVLFGGGLGETPGRRTARHRRILFLSSSARRKGFTMLEAMIALLLFVVMTLLFASSILVSRMSARTNGQYGQAISLCQHKIDQLRAVGYGRMSYTELSDADIVDQSPSAAPYSFTAVDNIAAILPSPTTTIVIQDGGTYTSRVTVTITWKKTTYQSKTSTASLTALITNVD